MKYVVLNINFIGENLGKNCEHYETDDRCGDAFDKEMEYRIESLRQLVCDLLKTNQDLREALMEARERSPGKEWRT